MENLCFTWEVEATMDFVRHESSILHHVHKNSVNHGFITAARANHWAMHHVYKTTDHPFVIRFIPTTTVSKVPLLTSPQLLELWTKFYVDTTIPAIETFTESSNGKQEEVVEMAFGMCNNQPFIWVVRPGSIIGSDG
ncbi:hypothetical protein IGI04_011083 [Brassica rapa subsp. trilocularis]|uniref:Uncharacterized protein n=1 Tax=Brassica rapa subsp. trilocularis TaxID=1813537 RepID=A0ABQ7N214_BRACM|nr:hypothetical protein IGI04_011083 [Brassica rapa subsp. trilocularis]